jgi:hypothetical protein
MRATAIKDEIAARRRVPLSPKNGFDDTLSGCENVKLIAMASNCKPDRRGV